MSAGTSVESMVQRSLEGCAPLFAAAVQDAIDECNEQGLDAFVYESLRSDELQRLYYARGRTTIPPHYTVTNARSAQFSWHFFGLAVDVISKSRGWETSGEWRRRVAAIFKSHGLAWGGDWPHPDLPHFQWGKCKRSPSDKARELYAEGGLQLVWQVVGATSLLSGQRSA